jgi:hypothetical protein
VRPSVRFVAEWDLPGEISVGVMPGLVLDRDAGGRRYAAGIAAITASKAFGDRWHGYLELAGQHLASARHGGSVVSVDFGGTCLVTDAVQLDLGFAVGATHQTPDLAWTLGLSVRF